MARQEPTAAEIRAFRELARAARKLRTVQESAERHRQHQSPTAAKGKGGRRP